MAFAVGEGVTETLECDGAGRAQVFCSFFDAFTQSWRVIVSGEEELWSAHAVAAAGPGPPIITSGGRGVRHGRDSPLPARERLGMPYWACSVTRGQQRSGWVRALSYTRGLTGSGVVGPGPPGCSTAVCHTEPGTVRSRHRGGETLAREIVLAASRLPAQMAGTRRACACAVS